MANEVTTQLIRIGNSQGIRIPKLLIEQASLSGELTLDVRDGELIVRSARSPRHAWGAEFQRMAESGDDQLLDRQQPPTDWEIEEWTW